MIPDALRDMLTQPWVHGAHFDGRGLRFTTPVVLDGVTLRSFDLSGAVFDQGLSARGAVFRGMAWLKGAEVHGPPDLRGAPGPRAARAGGQQPPTPKTKSRMEHVAV